jgi:hypothetical protein
MSQQIATLDDYAIRTTLITLMQSTFPLSTRLDFRLVGPAAAVVRGANYTASDIDILMKSHADVDTLGAALSAFQCLQPPTWNAETKEYRARYLIDGVQVSLRTVDIESDSDTHETYGRGPWEHFTVVICGVFRVPAVAPELQLITELSNKRPDHYNAIIETLRRRGPELALVKRGMDNIGIPKSRQLKILKQLQESK